MNLGGILGCLSIGYYSSKIGLKKSIQWVMILCAISMLAFAFSSGKLALMLPIAFLIGFFLLASMIGLYALAPDLYPTEIRTTGMGWSIGIGRLGAIAGPFLAGVLMSTGWSPGHCFFAFLFPLIFAALVVSRIKHLP